MCKINRLLLFCMLILLFSTALQAAYIKFQPVTLSQPDGTKLSLFASGDEFYNWLHDKDGYTVKQNDKGWYVYTELSGRELIFTNLIAGRDNPGSRNIAPWTNIPAEDIGQKRNLRQSQIADIGGDRVPHSGTLNNLVIFIRFADQTEFGQNLSYYNGMFNGAGNTMQAYFSEASYNALNISTSFFPTPTTTVVSWQDNQIRGYYSPYNATTNPTGYTSTNSTSREHTLLVNAVNGVSSQIPTSLNLDGDGDGKVDNVCFVIKGANDAWAELLWPHRWSLWSQTVSINGKRVYDYNFQLSDFLAGSGNGVLCHEMFHSLGSPDLYHYTSNGISPVGGWDLMESNANPPEHMSAYMKWKYVGWISSIPTISANGTYTLNPLSSATNNCYRINSPSSSSEYFVVEFRKKTGQFESSVPNSGLVIYRINTAASGNAGGPPDEVYAFRPNGTTTVNGTVNDAYFSEEGGRIMFNQYTNPYPFLQSGAAGGISLQAISSSAGTTMNFTLASGDPLVSLNEGFESGVPTGWANGGITPWLSETASYFSGTKSLKSGVITHSQNTTISTPSLAMRTGQISFFYKISSEVNYDYLKFYIDGTVKAQWSGEGAWAMVAFNVTAGYHILKWEYMKDGSVTTGSDAAWIDHIAYPAADFLPPQNLSAIAGNATVALTWSAPVSGSPTTYKIYRNSTLVATVAPLNYTDNAVTNGTTYSYYITAVYANPTGESATSNTVTATPSQNLIITVGTGTNINQSLPIEPYYGYTYSQSIYLQSELNIANKRIYKLAWQYNGNSAWSNDAVKIWMGHTGNIAFASTTGWLPVSGLTQVYDGTISVTTTPGWVELTLNTPFVYNNSNNLVIAVDENTPGYHASADEFLGSTVTGNRSIYFYSDTVNSDPAAPGTAMATPAAIPNVKLFFEDIPAIPVFSVNPTALSFSSLDLGQYSSQQLTVTNTGIGTLQINSITLSDNSHFQLLSLPAAYPVSLTAGASLSFNVRYIPATVGTHTASVIITDNLSRTAHSVTISGTCADNSVIPPYTQDFTTFLPSYWTQYSGLLATPTTLTSGTNWVADGFASNGTTGAARLNIWTTSTKNWLITPCINLGSGDATMRMEFDMALTAYNSTAAAQTTGTDDKFAVVISTDNGMTWSSANTLRLWDNTGSANVYNNIPTVGARYTLPLGSYSGRIRIGFYGESTVGNADNDLTIDNVTISLPPPAPIIRVTQTTLAFGDVAIGATAIQNLLIENIGNAALTGSVTTPEGYSAGAMASALMRNTQTFTIAPGLSQTCSVSLSPTQGISYNGILSISSNDATNPTITVNLTGMGYVPPTLNVDTIAIEATLTHGQTDNRIVQLSNSGSRDLNYNIQMLDTTGNPVSIYASATSTNGKPSLQPAGMLSRDDRSIAGSTFAVNQVAYLPGTNVIWTFTVMNASTDNEWLKDIQIQFPAGVTVLSSTAFVGGSGGELTSNAATGDGCFLIWHGQDASGWGLIHGAETATATVNVSISSELSDVLNMSYQINGDIYGAEPHVLTGNLSLPTIGWLAGNPLSGTISAGQTQQVSIDFISTATTPGRHLADYIVTSNDPSRPTVVIPCSMDVSLLEPSTTLSRSGTTLQLDWPAISGANQYRVYRSVSILDGYQLLDTVISNALLILDDNPVYFYKVVAVYQ